MGLQSRMDVDFGNKISGHLEGQFFVSPQVRQLPTVLLRITQLHMEVALVVCIVALL